MNKTGLVMQKIQGYYYVDVDGDIVECRLRGILKRDRNNRNCIVGDIVDIDDENSIINIHSRRNYIPRPGVSNVDNLLICFAIDKPKYDLHPINTLLLNAEYYKISPIIIINKIDLVDKIFLNDVKKQLDFLIDIKVPLFFISSVKNVGISKLKNKLENSISVFSGPSGVGKSSILNAISSNSNQKIGEISSKISRGKHTTRSAKLIKTDLNSYIIDTPGFSAIDLPPIKDKKDLQFYFPEIDSELGQCKFSNCVHINEPKCHIKNLVLEDKISKIRYDYYIKIYKEL